MKRYFRGRKLFALLITILLATVPLFLFYSCGGKFSDPTATVTSTSVLITPSQLNGWITNGYGTDSSGFNKMVILDVTTGSSYTTSHVQNAFLLDTATTDWSATRSDGPDGTDGVAGSGTINEVPTQGEMNSLIQRTGIDANTVVVLTGDSLLNVGKAYFNFRYWGFPKNRLKVLDRTNAAYVTAGFTLVTTVPPAPTPSSYTVCSLTQNTSLRAPLSEMITVAEGGVPNSQVWDVRTTDEYNGVSASQTKGPTGSGYVAFEGHIKGAINLPYDTASLNAPTNNTILDAATIRTNLSNAGFTPDKTTYVY
jgi:3-mercaptopyruvate sulfurtransferase SseA